MRNYIVQVKGFPAEIFHGESRAVVKAEAARRLVDLGYYKSTITAYKDIKVTLAPKGNGGANPVGTSRRPKEEENED